MRKPAPLRLDSTYNGDEDGRRKERNSPQGRQRGAPDEEDGGRGERRETASGPLAVSAPSKAGPDAFDCCHIPSPIFIVRLVRTSGVSIIIAAITPPVSGARTGPSPGAATITIRKPSRWQRTSRHSPDHRPPAQWTGPGPRWSREVVTEIFETLQHVLRTLYKAMVNRPQSRAI